MFSSYPPLCYLFFDGVKIKSKKTTNYYIVMSGLPKWEMVINRFYVEKDF